MVQQSKIYLYTHELPAGIELEQLVSWFKHHRTAATFFWETPNQRTQVLTWGIFEKVAEEHKPASFDHAAHRLNRLLQRTTMLGQAQKSDLKTVGGLRFAAEAALPTNWGGLSNGAVWIPKVVFEKQRQTIRCSVIGSTSRAVTDQFNQIVGELTRETKMAPRPAKLTDFNESDVHQWESGVARAVQEIQATELDKVVLGRFAQGNVSQVVPEALWLQLRQTQAGSYHILLRVDDITFLSATPERLLSFQPNHIWTAAVAGTTKRGRTPEEDRRLTDQLLADPKNLREHAFVVDWITRILREDGLQVTARDTPEILQTPAVSHLYTPIEATGATHATRLLSQMHPTPALGGVPQRQAVRLIAILEVQQRGLFGAPIGMIDGAGAGEFAVGIRSCFIRGHQAHFFAGAGIVSDSIPAKEAAETGEKFNAILSIFERKQS